MTPSRRTVLTGTALALAVAMTGPAMAQDAVDFTGETITMIVPYGPGGGTSAHARLFATQLEQTLPGQPTILVENIEGGGSIIGANQFVADAEPDGMTILAIGASTILNQLFADDRVQYDLGSMIPFVSSPTGTVVYGLATYQGGLPDDPIEMVRTYIENPPVVAVQSLTSSDLGVLFSYDLLGIKPQVVFGISLGESRGGLQRGEFQMRHDTMASYANEVVPLVEDGTVNLMFTMGFEQDGVIVRDPVAPGVPHFLEVYEAIHGEPLSGTEYDVWKALFDIRVMVGKMILLPEGTPQEIVDAYAQAAADALELPEMNTEAALLILGDYPQVVGSEESTRILQGALGLTDARMSWISDWADELYGGL